MRRARRTTTAPQPITMKFAKADPDGLRQAYEWMTVDRTTSLRLALDWYNANLTTLLRGDPLDADRQKSYDRGVKSAAIGDHTTFDGEREASWTMALRQFEKTWAAKNLPTVGEAMQASDIGSVPMRRVTDVKTVIEMLNSAYDKLVTFRITFRSEREFDGEQVLIPIAELTAMVPQTPLKSALGEAVTVAKVLSVALDPETNEKVMDGARFMVVLPEILAKVADWAVTGDLARKAVGKATVAKPTVTTAHKSGVAAKVRAARNNPKIKFRDSDVFRVPKPFVNGNGRTGKAGQAFDLLTDGITYRQYKAAVIKANPKNGGWYVLDTLRYAVAHGLATVA